MEQFTIGQQVQCVFTDLLKGNTIKPPLELKTYKIQGICTDSKGNQHLDFGLTSKYKYITSYETKEELPDGDIIHWCHPSRFKPV